MLFDLGNSGLAFGWCATAEDNIIAGSGTAERLDDFKAKPSISASYQDDFHDAHIEYQGIQSQPLKLTLDMESVIYIRGFWRL